MINNSQCLISKSINDLSVNTLPKLKTTQLPKSRSEQAPGSEFHPRGESDNIDCGFLGPSWGNKKVNPDT